VFTCLSVISADSFDGENFGIPLSFRPHDLQLKIDAGLALRIFSFIVFSAFELLVIFDNFFIERASPQCIAVLYFRQVFWKPRFPSNARFGFPCPLERGTFNRDRSFGARTRNEAPP